MNDADVPASELDVTDERPVKASEAARVRSTAIAAASGRGRCVPQVTGARRQEANLKASHARAGTGFGNVALHGDVLVVGAPGEDSAAVGVDGDQSNDGAHDAGAAYVFTRSDDRPVAIQPSIQQ